jgi:hypothetical protein
MKHKRNIGVEWKKTDNLAGGEERKKKGMVEIVISSAMIIV